MDTAAHPFDTHVADYDAWFTAHPAVFASEVEALAALHSDWTEAVEVGVGTGRFAEVLGISRGVEPSAAMAAVARTRGLEVLPGRAEQLPLPGSSIPLLVYITTFCFVDDPHATLEEAHRVLSPGGHIVIAFIDTDAPAGRAYLDRQASSVFYRNAHLRSGVELSNLLAEHNFNIVAWRQALFTDVARIHKAEPSRAGHGDGLFAVVKARVTAHHPPHQPPAEHAKSS